MQISVRSYLAAGVTAVVGAGAIAVAPTLPTTLRAVELPTPAIAEIALTGTSLPLEQIWTLVQTLGSLGSDGSISGIVNVIFSNVGAEVAAQALPLVTAAATDVLTYLSPAFSIDFPGIFSGVGAALGAGDFPGALQTLTGGLSAPITHVVEAVFGSDFQAFLGDKVGTVLGALPELLRSAVQKVLGLDIKPVIDAITTAISGLLPGAAAAAVSVPVALATAEAPAAVPAVPVPAAAQAPAAPRSAAAVSADGVADHSAVEAQAVDAPAADAPAVEAQAAETAAPAVAPVTAPAQTPAPDVETGADAAATPTRAVRRAADASDSSTAVSAPNPGAHQRSAGASSASGERAGR